MFSCNVIHLIWRIRNMKENLIETFIANAWTLEDNLSEKCF